MKSRQTPAFDRAAVMRDAHKRFRDGRRLGLGWTWSQCLSTAWQAAKIRRAAMLAKPATILERAESSLARPIAA